MSLPDQPSVFRRPNASERPWSWRLLDADAAETTVEGDLGEQRFLSQGDAESWIGEVWPALLAEGVEQVVLLEVDREVYGPMSLRA